MKDFSIGILICIILTFLILTPFVKDTRDVRERWEDEIYQSCSRINGTGSIVFANSRIIKCSVR